MPSADFLDTEGTINTVARTDVHTNVPAAHRYVATGLNIANRLAETVTCRLEKWNGAAWVVVCEGIEIAALDAFEYFENGAKMNIGVGKRLALTVTSGQLNALAFEFSAMDYQP